MGIETGMVRFNSSIITGTIIYLCKHNIFCLRVEKGERFNIDAMFVGDGSSMLVFT